MSVRWSEQDLAQYIRRGQPAPVSEAAFMAAVVRIARQAGYTFAYHTYRSTRSPSGFPDLILCHTDPGQVCYAIETKTETGIVSQAQQAWLEALGQCRGVIAEVWRPSMLEEICTKLRT
jgi:hypothetical protein